MKCNRLILFLLVVTALAPLTSWMLAAFGVNVRSLISEEGLRWLFVDGLDAAFNVCVRHFILLVIVFSSFRWVYRHAVKSHRRSRALIATGTAAFVLLSVLSLLAFSHNSPLLNISGQLWPSSPFVQGLPEALCVCALLLISLFGYMDGLFTSIDRFVEMLTDGFHRYGRWMLIAMIVGLDCEVVKFMFQ